jgi:thioredoxin-like negative regulator of GroEL
MRIRLNRFTALLLLILLLPIKLYRWLTGTGKKPVYPSTLEGDPLAYSGERPVVVALWATWASVWSAATEQIVRDLHSEFAGKCEFVYIEATGRSVLEKYGVEVIPTVLVFHGGREVGRFINLLEAAELRECVAQRVAAEPGVAPDPRRQ